MNSLVIVGASGHGKVVADIAERNGYSDIMFLDDNRAVKLCGNYKVVGQCKDAMNYHGNDFVVAIGNARIRCSIQTELSKANLHIVSLIHPNAIIATNVKIGIGTVVMAGAVLNPYVEIGKGCIINTCASVDHDCRIGDFVHVSVGAHVAGNVIVQENTWIGAGATISNNVEIVSGCMIGAGAVVVNSISERGTYVGVPGRKLK